MSTLLYQQIQQLIASDLKDGLGLLDPTHPEYSYVHNKNVVSDFYQALAAHLVQKHPDDALMIGINQQNRQLQQAIEAELSVRTYGDNAYAIAVALGNTEYANKVAKVFIDGLINQDNENALIKLCELKNITLINIFFSVHAKQFDEAALACAKNKALFNVAQKRQSDVVAVLLKHGARLDDDEHTQLKKAINEGSLTQIKVLLLAEKDRDLQKILMCLLDAPKKDSLEKFCGTLKKIDKVKLQKNISPFIFALALQLNTLLDEEHIGIDHDAFIMATLDSLRIARTLNQQPRLNLPRDLLLKLLKHFIDRELYRGIDIIDQFYYVADEVGTQARNYAKETGKLCSYYFLNSRSDRFINPFSSITTMWRKCSRVPDSSELSHLFAYRLNNHFGSNLLTPFLVAVDQYSTKEDGCPLALRFLTCGSKLNEIANNGDGALHIAVRNNHPLTVAQLVIAGVPQDIKNKANQTAFELAKKIGDREDCISALTNPSVFTSQIKVAIAADFIAEVKKQLLRTAFDTTFLDDAMHHGLADIVDYLLCFAKEKADSCYEAAKKMALFSLAKKIDSIKFRLDKLDSEYITKIDSCKKEKDVGKFKKKYINDCKNIIEQEPNKYALYTYVANSVTATRSFRALLGGQSDTTKYFLAKAKKYAYTQNEKGTAQLRREEALQKEQEPRDFSSTVVEQAHGALDAVATLAQHPYLQLGRKPAQKAVAEPPHPVDMTSRMSTVALPQTLYPAINGFTPTVLLPKSETAVSSASSSSYTPALQQMQLPLPSAHEQPPVTERETSPQHQAMTSVSPPSSTTTVSSPQAKNQQAVVS